MWSSALITFVNVCVFTDIFRTRVCEDTDTGVGFIVYPSHGGETETRGQCC